MKNPIKYIKADKDIYENAEDQIHTKNDVH